MNQAAVVPAARLAPAVDTATLVRWLTQGRNDQSRPVLTLDTRNRFVVNEGTFDVPLTGTCRSSATFGKLWPDTPTACATKPW